MKPSINQITAQWEDHSNALHKAIMSDNALPHINTESSALDMLNKLLLLLQASEDKALIVTDKTVDALDIEITLSLMDQPISYQLILPHSKERVQVGNRLIITTIPTLIIGNENQSKKWVDYNILLYNPNAHSQCDHTLILKRFFEDSFKEKRLIPFIQQDILESSPLKLTENIVDTNKKSIDSKAEKSKKTTQAISLNDRKQPELDNQLESINIAMLQGNFKRQYIRDQIRNERLKDVVVVTNNHQEARQLQNYLYRGRIRTKTIHNRTPDKIEEQITDEFNSNRLTVLVILDEKLEVIKDKLTHVEHLYLYDLPNAYVELIDLLLKTHSFLNPKEQIALATNNQRAWVEALGKECPKQTINIREIEGNQPRRRFKAQNQQRVQTKESETTQSAKVENLEKSPPPAISSEPNRETKRTNNQQRSSNRPNNRQRNNNAPNRQRREQNRQQPPRQQQANQQNNQQNNINDNLGNSADQGQGNIVNRNRLPFEANSFEANIAKLNRRRGRATFSGDPNRNFAQELEDHHQRGNQRQRNNRRNNNNNVDGNR